MAERGERNGGYHWIATVPGTPRQQSGQSAVRLGLDGCENTGRKCSAGFQHTMLQQKPQPGMSARKHARNAKRSAWCGAQWIPQQQTFMQQTAQARAPSFWFPGGPRPFRFPNLGVNPMNYQGNMPSGRLACNFVAFGDRTGNYSQSMCCNFLFVPWVGLCFEFHDLIFGTARSHFETVFNHFSKFFVSELQKCNVWVAL